MARSLPLGENRFTLLKMAEECERLAEQCDRLADQQDQGTHLGQERPDRGSREDVSALRAP